MKKVVELGYKLSLEERKQFSVAYKTVVDARRSAWRVIHSVEKQSQGSAQLKQHMVREFRAKVETELRGICNEMLYLLEALLVSNGAAVSRYQRSHQDGFNVAKGNLQRTHPTRLEMALNLCIFHYEILGAPDNALQPVRKTLRDAVCGLASLDERSSQKTRRIVQWLRDIVLRWTSNVAAGERSEANPLDDDIKSIIETKLRSVKPSVLNLEDLAAYLKNVNTATMISFHNNTGTLRDFLEKEC